jgi:hypothetical protein
MAGGAVPNHDARPVYARFVPRDRDRLCAGDAGPRSSPRARASFSARTACRIVSSSPGLAAERGLRATTRRPLTKCRRSAWVSTPARPAHAGPDSSGTVPRCAEIVSARFEEASMVKSSPLSRRGVLLASSEAASALGAARGVDAARCGGGASDHRLRWAQHPGLVYVAAAAPARHGPPPLPSAGASRPGHVDGRHDRPRAAVRRLARRAGDPSIRAMAGRAMAQIVRAIARRSSPREPVARAWTSSATNVWTPLQLTNPHTGSVPTARSSPTISGAAAVTTLGPPIHPMASRLLQK